MTRQTAISIWAARLWAVPFVTANVARLTFPDWLFWIHEHEHDRRKYRAENLISDAFSRDIRHCRAANEWVCGGDAMNSASRPSEALALTWFSAQCAARRLDQRRHDSVLISIQKEQIWHFPGGISDVKHDMRPNLVGRLRLQQLIQKFVKQELKLMTYWKSHLLKIPSSVKTFVSEWRGERFKVWVELIPQIRLKWKVKMYKNYFQIENGWWPSILGATGT